jgi:hypothetical protein
MRQGIRRAQQHVKKEVSEREEQDWFFKKRK